MTMLDFGMEVMTQPRAVAITALDALDAAVLTAYDFSAKQDWLARVLALNQDVAAKIEKGQPVTAPGVPKNYPDAKKLVTEDCIRPQM
jgi:hypothetical protein